MLLHLLVNGTNIVRRPQEAPLLTTDVVEDLIIDHQTLNVVVDQTITLVLVDTRGDWLGMIKVDQKLAHSMKVVTKEDQMDKVVEDMTKDTNTRVVVV